MTARLGFGCSGLMARLDRAQSEALLVAAYEAGIRWFDVARSYGYGEAEGVVGRFLARLVLHEVELTLVADKILAHALDASGKGDGGSPTSQDS